MGSFVLSFKELEININDLISKVTSAHATKLNPFAGISENRIAQLGLIKVTFKNLLASDLADIHKVKIGTGALLYLKNKILKEEYSGVWQYIPFTGSSLVQYIEEAIGQLDDASQMEALTYFRSFLENEKFLEYVLQISVIEAKDALENRMQSTFISTFNQENLLNEISRQVSSKIDLTLKTPLKEIPLQEKTLKERIADDVTSEFYKLSHSVLFSESRKQIESFEKTPSALKKVEIKEKHGLDEICLVPDELQTKINHSPTEEAAPETHKLSHYGLFSATRKKIDSMLENPLQLKQTVQKELQGFDDICLVANEKNEQTMPRIMKQ